MEYSPAVTDKKFCQWHRQETICFLSAVEISPTVSCVLCNALCWKSPWAFHILWIQSWFCHRLQAKHSPLWFFPSKHGSLWVMNWCLGFFLHPVNTAWGKLDVSRDLGSKMVNTESHVSSNNTVQSTAVLNPKSTCRTLQRENTPSLWTAASNISSYGISLLVKKESELSFSFKRRKTTLAVGQSQQLEHWFKMEQIAVGSCLCLNGEDTHIFQKWALPMAVSHTPLPFVETVPHNGSLL